MPATPTHKKRFANLAETQTLDVIQALTPEWLRVPAAMRVTGLSRNTIFRHIKDGTLRAKHYMQPGNSKGVMFVSFSSLMALMNGLPDGKDILPKEKP